jgi:menaquinone-dependent protoporphyrinogen IX oxidase
MEVLVAYEGRRGRTRRAADVFADVLASRSVATIVRDIDAIGAGDLSAADAMIAGCFTPGDVPFGGPPTEHMSRWIEALPDLDGMAIAVFCTYTFFPHTFADTAARTAETLNEMSTRFELRGGKVVATRSMYTKSLEAAAADLVDKLLQYLR